MRRWRTRILASGLRSGSRFTTITTVRTAGSGAVPANVTRAIQTVGGRQAMRRLVFFVVAACAGVPAFGQTDVKVPEGVRIEGDVEYLEPGRTEKADLYLPASVIKGQRRPAVLIIHGGGWTGGDKAAAREFNIGTNLVLHGYVGMSIDYVLSTQGKVTWPQNLYDCKTAVRWLRKNAERLQIDPDHIGVIGGSAGGHLAAMVGLTGPADGLDPKGPYGEFSCRVQCAVDLYGPADLLQIR